MIIPHCKAEESLYYMITVLTKIRKQMQMEI